MNADLFRVLNQTSSVILGKEPQVRLALTCLIAGGHLLIEDLPGIGKTTLAKALALSLGLDFSRVQCTNDMLPGDILGVSIFDQQQSGFIFHPGPVFSHLLLADEINRATPKTQSALLEVMEEQQVTIDGQTHLLEEPFFVIATQNPLEQAGTYPLPESQLDRFLMRISLGYPARESEIELLSKGGAVNLLDNVGKILDRETLIAVQREVKEVYVSELLYGYVQDLLTFSRSSGKFVVGLSPRAGLSLVKAAQGYAYLDKRDHLLAEDLQTVLPYVASHRLRASDSGQQFIPESLTEIFKEVALPL